MRDLLWVGSSHADLTAFPEGVRHVMGFALYRAQLGRMPSNAKPLKGFGGAGVVEIVDDDDGDTYRTVYTVRLRSAVYVLHAFQKKSTRGVARSKRDLDLIQSRLILAQQDDAARLARATHEKGES